METKGPAQHITVESEDPLRESARWRHLILSAARETGFMERDAWSIASAVFEAYSNAVIHGLKGRSGRVTLSILTYDDRLEAIVQDSGDGFSCGAVTPVPSARSSRGRGIPLMRTFMDEVRFEHSGGCKVVLTKYLVSGEQLL